MKQRLYSGRELCELLRDVGFATVVLAGGLDTKVPYDEAAKRLVAVAHASAVAHGEDAHPKNAKPVV